MPRVQDDFDQSSWDSGTIRSGSLTDICGEAFAVIFGIHSGADPGHPDDLRKNISTIFRNIERKAQQSGYGEEDVKACRYALCALIDETILNSGWAFRDQWGDSPLQLQHFNDNMAGERFFDLLERVRKKGRRKADLLEVFCMCLILGFQGKYKLGGKDTLEKLRNAVIEEAGGSRRHLSVLSEHWQIPDEPVSAPKQAIPKWAWISGLTLLALLILSYAIYYFWLGSLADDAASRMIL